MKAEHLLGELRAALAKLPPDGYLNPAELWSFLDGWEQKARREELEHAQAREVARLRIADEKHRRDALVELQIKVLAAVFEKANGYVNLLVIAGYAAFFALWSFTKEIDAISQPMRRWSVLLMLASVCTFVAFETGKVVFTGWVTTKRQRLFVQQSVDMSLEELETAAAAMQAGIDRATVSLLRLWPWCLGASVATAGAAMTLVVAAIIRALLAGKI